MRGVLECHVIRRDDDVAHERQVGMALGRAVDSGDHRHFDAEHRVDHLPRIDENFVHTSGRQFSAVEKRGIRIEPRPAEFGTGAGQDDDAVLAVGADIRKSAHEFNLRIQIPLQRTAVGMQTHLQYAAPPLHLDEAITAAVLIELRHSCLHTRIRTI